MSASSSRPRTPSSAPAEGEEASASRIVDAWCAMDHTYAFLTADHALIEATRGVRTLIAECLLREPVAAGRDLLHAFAALGRMMADKDASPTLAASSVDGLVHALAECRGLFASSRDVPLRDFILPARAAMMETYVHTRRLALHDEAMRAWDYPACVVPLEEGYVAIAAGHPDEDAEALQGWASRVAQGAARDGVRRAIVSGGDRPVAAILEALQLSGIELMAGYHRKPTKPPEARPR